MTEAAPTLKLISGSELEAELRLRRSAWLYKRVAPSDVAAHEVDGWTEARVNKNSVRLQKAKPIDQALEDDVWSLLARLGFIQLSQGHRFVIPVTKGPGQIVSKQIDVLAADDETALVVECKASAPARPRSMARDLAEAYALRGAVISALRQHYGIKKKIGWLFVTRGIIWGDNDRARADEFKIRVLTDNDLDYFLRLADHLGTAARHQLQAEVFGDQQIEGLNRTVPAVRGRIGGRRFYQFTIDPDRLLKIAFISHRARLDAESVGAYQRMLRKGRLRDIRRYIDEGGVFPTNVVVNFRTRRRFELSADKSDGDVALGTLYLPNTYKSAWIIDGQHRLYGFVGSKWSKSTQLPVLAFEALPPSEEARLFVDINNKQVKVQRSLLVELMSELYWDSPIPDEAYHAVLSRIVAVLGKDIASPFRGRMVQEGDTQTADTPLTVTAVYESLKKSNLVGAIRKGVFDPGPLYDGDAHKAVRRSVDVLSKYFRLFADALPDHWSRGNGEGGYLCTNNGVSALLLVLGAIVDHLDQFGSPKPWQATPQELEDALHPFAAPITEIFKKADLPEIRQYRRQVGNAGQRQAAFAMMEAVQSEKPGFNPEGLAEFIRSQDQTGTNTARQLMPELQLTIHDATMTLLRSLFGHDESGWWRKGVPEKVRTEVAARRETNPEGGAYDQFFELLDYRSIAAANWDSFDPYFAFGPGKGKENQLAWFGKLGAIRNRIAHPERGTVSEEELAFIEALADHFEKVAAPLL
jgi:DNA sulfur modification protein DndB